MSDFKKKICIKKSRFGSFYSVKTTYFEFFVRFGKIWIWFENFITCQILNWEKYNASDSEFEKIQRVLFRI